MRASSGLKLMKTTTDPAGKDLSIDHQPRHALRVELGCDDRHDPSHQGERPSHFFALGDRVNCRGGPKRREQQRGLSFTRHRNDGGRLTGRRERHGGLTQGQTMPALDEIGRQRDPLGGNPFRVFDDPAERLNGLDRDTARPRSLRPA